MSREALWLSYKDLNFEPVLCSKFPASGSWVFIHHVAIVRCFEAMSLPHEVWPMSMPPEVMNLSHDHATRGHDLPHEHVSWGHKLTFWACLMRSWTYLMRQQPYLMSIPHHMRSSTYLMSLPYEVMNLTHDVMKSTHEVIKLPNFWSLFWQKKNKIRLPSNIFFRNFSIIF